MSDLMERRKIFVLDNEKRWGKQDVNIWIYNIDSDYHYKSGDELAKLDKRTKKIWDIIKGGLDVAVDTECKNYLGRHLPEEYDGYWIHFSMTSPEALTELRRKQPWTQILVSSKGDSREIVTRNLGKEIADSLQIVYGTDILGTWYFFEEVALIGHDPKRKRKNSKK